MDNILGPADTGRLCLLYLGYEEDEEVILTLFPLAMSPSHPSKVPGTPGPTALRKDEPRFLGGLPLEFTSVLSLVMEGVPGSTSRLGRGNLQLVFLEGRDEII